MRRLTPLLLLVILAACVNYSSNYEVVTEFDGPYNAQIIQEVMTAGNGEEVTVPRIRYFKDFMEYRAYFPPNMKPAMDFISNSTPIDSAFLSWWDYGHVIRGYTGREVIVDSPSEGIKHTVSSGYEGGLSSEAKIKDVATAFSTTNDTVLKNIMAKYNAKYIYVYQSDPAKSWFIFEAAGVDPGEYITFLSDGNYKTSKLGDQTMLFRIFNGVEISGFKVLYDDGISKVLELEE